ncbi:hypothetical protein [Nocardiopsis alba]|uniref:hypothetical protein n=1 Tax=Nocardiopsis alba TaxID=53437 RepID=UPI001F4C5842|nr:hypothetical protein [Nocardiopsis alba]
MTRERPPGERGSVDDASPVRGACSAWKGRPRGPTKGSDVPRSALGPTERLKSPSSTLREEKNGTGSSMRSLNGTALCVASVLLLSACGTPMEAVRHDTDTEYFRPPLTLRDLAAVEEFLAESGRVVEEDLLVSSDGAVAVLADEVVSVAMDPVEEVWSYPAEDVTDVGVTADGASVVVEYREALGPIESVWTVVLGSKTGNVLDSHRSWGSASEGIGELTEDSRVLVEQDTVVTFSSLAGAEALWERDLSEACASGDPREVRVATLERRVLASYACPGEGTVHVEAFHAASGETFWERFWNGDSVPEVQPWLSKEVPGDGVEPVTTMFADGATGRTSILTLRENGYAPEVLDPWRAIPDLNEFIEKPLLDMDPTPERIIFTDDRNMTENLLIVRSIHALVEDESVPFSEDDVDESLKIEGELAENPRQWNISPEAYVFPLRDEIEIALF